MQRPILLVALLAAFWFAGPSTADAWLRGGYRFGYGGGYHYGYGYHSAGYGGYAHYNTWTGGHYYGASGGYNLTPAAMELPGRTTTLTPARMDTPQRSITLTPAGMPITMATAIDHDLSNLEMS